MIKHCFPILFLLALALPAYAETEVYLNISRKGMEKIKVAIPDFLPSDARVDNESGKINKSAAVLRSDLYITEYFSILWNNEFVNSAFVESQKLKHIDYEEWKLFGIDYVVTGTYSSSFDGSIVFTFELHNLSSGKLILRKKYQGKESMLREIIHRFADEVLLNLTGEKGVATTKLLFESLNKGNKTIYISDYDGANLLQVSESDTLSLSPTWSDDNKKVYYTSYRNDNPGILSHDLMTGRKSWFANKKGLNNAITVSQNGLIAAYCHSQEGNADIYIFNFLSGKESQLTKEISIETSPALSPDGRKVAFVSDRHGSPQIFMMDVDGGPVERLTYQGNYNVEPAWSPDGDKIAFTSIMDGIARIAIVYIADKKIQYISEEGPYRVVSPSWSPNGRYLIYSSNKTGGYQLYRLNVATGTSGRVTYLTGGAYSPSWSFFWK